VTSLYPVSQASPTVSRRRSSVTASPYPTPEGGYGYGDARRRRPKQARRIPEKGSHDRYAVRSQCEPESEGHPASRVTQVLRQTRMGGAVANGGSTPMRTMRRMAGPTLATTSQEGGAVVRVTPSIVAPESICEHAARANGRGLRPGSDSSGITGGITGVPFVRIRGFDQRRQLAAAGDRESPLTSSRLPIPGVSGAQLQLQEEHL
jgi:hypothetical protein